jgi:hypothetical protein
VQEKAGFTYSETTDLGGCPSRVFAYDIQIA